MRYVAFLKGINLGKRRVAMNRLKELFEELGLTEVGTFIASGNVLFSSSKGTPKALEAQIEKQLKAKLGYQVDTFVRTAKEVERITASKVIRDVEEQGLTIHVGFLKEKLDAGTTRKLKALRTDRDWFHVSGTEFIWFTRGRMSDSKVWTLPEAKEVRLPTATMRNITSLQKLVAKHFAETK